jgi:hypothetical protein
MISRRLFVRGAASVPLMHLCPASASYNDAQTIFMLDAIAEIRKDAGLLTTSDDSDSKDLDSQLKRYDELRTRPERRTRLERWGGVCVPDFDYYYTDGLTSWLPNEGQKLPAVTVPDGFCTDLASIPQVFWSLGLPRTGRYAYAAIVHDFLYWTQTTTQWVADQILLAAMKDTEVKWITRHIIYDTLRLGFGKVAWDNNAKAKASGAKRFLKDLPSHREIVSWKDWSKDPSHFSD